jgi:hypothetical protein
LKARERTEIFDSLLFEELDGICGPCHHREVVEEEERDLYRNLPADDWRNSTVFKRLLLLKGDRILIEEALVKFGVSAQEASSCNKGPLEQLFKDKLFQFYVPMSKVNT